MSAALPDPAVIEALLRVLRAQNASGCEITTPDGLRVVLTLAPALEPYGAAGLDIQDLRDGTGPGGWKR